VKRALWIYGAAAATAAALFFFDPATTSFYPPCLFKTVLGMQCPGCGSLRAAHQLLHGNVEAAWALNKPVVLALPLALAAASLSFFLRRSSSSPPST
jgi:hypothetical protein